MTRTKLLYLMTFVRDRLRERSTRLAIAGLLTSLGFAAFGSHVDPEVVVAGLTLAIVMLTPEGAGA